MQIELEVKDVIRREMSPERKAKQICKFTSFKEDLVIKVLSERYKTPGKAYLNIIRLHKKRRKNGMRILS